MPAKHGPRVGRQPTPAGGSVGRCRGVCSPGKRTPKVAARFATVPDQQKPYRRANTPLRVKELERDIATDLLRLSCLGREAPCGARHPECGRLPIEACARRVRGDFASCFRCASKPTEMARGLQHAVAVTAPELGFAGWIWLLRTDSRAASASPCRNPSPPPGGRGRRPPRLWSAAWDTAGPPGLQRRQVRC